ncbi:MAG TPA: hypothetical protein VHO25_09155 [Polyangiaceae bacterium]|nr:hypothetical protein [Polyangiaceae bacterium]
MAGKKKKASKGKGKRDKKDAAKGKDSKRKVETYTDSLRVDLTVEEVADRADRAAHMLVKIDEKKAEIKAERQLQNKQLANLETEHHRLSGEVLSKSTYKKVVCKRTYDFDAKTVTEIREDTGEELGERPMTDDELQVNFSFEDDAEKEFGDGGDDDGAAGAEETPPGEEAAE